MNTARRIASGGRGQVFSKDPRASGRYLRNPATRRRGEDDSQTGGPDDPDDPELDKSYSWGELGDGLDLAGDLLGRGDRGAGLDQMASVAHRDQIDERMDFARYQEGPMRLGWLVNMHATSVMDIERNSVKSAVDYYFLEPDGRAFKCTLLYEPYFYIICREGTTGMVEEWVRRRFEKIERTERIEKEDLQMANHLTGRKRKLLKLVFRNVQDLLGVRKVMLKAVKQNEERQEVVDAYMDAESGEGRSAATTLEPEDCIIGMREYDVPYYLRVAIDRDIRVGHWYDVTALAGGSIEIKRREDLVERADPVVLAFDIETTKLPLKFPDASIDMVMMISYMIDGQGYLITNREIVSEDIDDFEYTPKAEYPGPFIIFNEPHERAVLERFFEHINEAKPTVIVTYNGDFFDWPFVHARAAHHGIDLYDRIGWFKDESGEYKSYYCAHMDCLRWVKRDSYLPMGSQGLKAVTTAKLGYNPMELDPEDMTRFASERPQILAQYSVSDAVATYYLYMKYIHPFIFSLCNIIPMNPDDVLRKGSGTLCETLLMVQAYEAIVVMPNKHQDPLESTWNGHLIETETYVGGHVEALEAGVFRSDIPMHFSLDPEGPQILINELDRALKFSIEVEGKLSMDDIANYDEVRAAIITKLEDLRDNPVRHETPLIYHLDVAAMYPNIILTNRLQPDSIVSDTVCATCDFNVSGKQCDRRMPWLWRGEFYPAQRNEVNMIRSQLESEMFPPKNPADLAKLRKSGGTDRSLMRTYTELSPDERAKLLRKRVSEYSRKVYHRLRDTQVQERTAVVCQRENPFYINTVRNFRDRRYIYKGLLKKEKKKLDTAFASGDQTLVSQGKKLVVLYDSLQLAHKCILNSFYGYVMRKQARWHSLEMAGVVCLTGSRIIQMARSRIDQLGRPLELDTDGIWCALPGIFPENYKFELKDGKGTFGISYPCTMLNHLVHDQFTNHQYQDLVDKDTFEYSMRSENSIFFEVDGPYKAMILPSSLEEDKLLKKRYAVFNDDGSLAELKGFEIKRRGELKLIKIFQSQIFGVFLEGKTLEECYAAVAKVANQWLDILFSRAVSLPEHELFDLITENRSMSKALESYGSQKSTAICTARRLAEFLGDQMVKDKGLACKFIISDKPHGLPVSERAIPVAIFSAEDSIKATYLRRWLKDPKLKDFDVRNILDWNYYLERFGSVIQKLITIPAAMQKVRNPVPRIKHPEWLVRKLRNMDDKSKQFRLTGMFKKVTRDEYLRESEDRARKVEVAGDIEDGVGGLVEAGDGKELTRVHRGVCRVSANARKRKRSGGGCDRDGEGEMAAATGEDSLTEAQQIEEAIRTLDERMPLISEDYARWLEVQKRKWVLQRQLRQLRKSQQQRAAKGGEGGVRTLSYPHAGGARDLSKFFSRAGHGSTGASSPWHVLQITETSTPGQLQAWVMILNQLHTVQITVPRTFYVSSSVPNDRTDSIPYLEDAKGMILPRVAHQTAAQYLYKCTVSESVFTEHQQEWASFFSHPSVVGVYETHISPLQRALINLGAMVQHHRRAPNFGGSSSNGGAAYSSDSSVHLDNLERFTPKSSQEGDAYQQTCVNGVKYIYLYHASARDGRQLFGLITTPNARGRVFVVDANARHLQMPNLEKLYEAKAREHKAQLKATTVSGSEIREAFEYPSAITFTATPYSTATAAYRAINTELSRYASERRGATFVVYHSPKPSSTMISTNLRVLGEFPHIAMPFHAADGQLAPLDWQRQAIKRMMGHYFHVAAWVQDRVELAKYANVPVGNLPADLPPMFLADIVFARRLVQAKHVLWWSSASRPDLGGREGDESEAAGLDLAELLDDISDGVAKKSKLALAGWKRRVETNSPGSYDTLCVDLDIQGLAVGTVVQAPHVNELEGTSGLGKFGAPAAAAAADDAEGRTAAVASIPLGDGAVPESIFQNLRSLLRGWCVQVAETNNRYAIMLAEHFYRWLTHPGSMLYDPSLVKLVRGLMAKVLMQLRAQVRKLGSKVVHCNSERLTIATSMKTVDAASAYVKYLVKTLAGQPVFEQISLVPVNYWLRLLWMDTCNFGGVAQPATAVASSESGSQGGSNEGSITTEPRVEMMWRIKEYLPPVTHQHFDSIVAQFTYELYQFSQETKSVIRSADDDDSKGNGGGDDVGGREEEEAMDPGPGSPGGLADDEPNPDNAGDNGGSGRGNDSARKLTKSKLWTMRNTFYRTLITQRFTRLLLDLVPRIQEACSPGHLPEEGSEEARFPPLPGIIPELHTGDAALEFVKAVVAVLSLESDAEFHVRILRRNLLSLLNVGEFSQMAFFQNPCQRLVLPQVVCDYCNYCRDVDFCQDADLSRPSATKGGENCGGSQVWSCVCCGQPYNRTVIEERLVQIAQQLVLAFQLQDLKCLKCRMVKQDNLNRHCQHCSGEFANQVPRSAMVRKLRIFASVAKYFRMPILNEVADSVLGSVKASTDTDVHPARF